MQPARHALLGMQGPAIVGGGAVITPPGTSQTRGTAMKLKIAAGAATLLVGVFATAGTSAALTCTANLTQVHADTAAVQADAATLSTDEKALGAATAAYKVSPTPANKAALTAATAKVAADNAKLSADEAKLKTDSAHVPVTCV
jgi:hypothetical protein